MTAISATTTSERFFIQRDTLGNTRFSADPDAPAQRPLLEGQARLVIEHFALTANNITYASFGQAMKYWQFFPAGDEAWGCLPVWGYASVLESRVDGLALGQRVYGYLPAGTHLVVQASKVSARGFVDAAAHREELAAVYNQYSFVDAAEPQDRHAEGLQAVLRPLFTTSFLIDDFLDDNHFFGAEQVVLSSASSKTAYGTAFCLARRRGSLGAPQVVGLTSAANRAFTRSLGCYDLVLAYDELPNLDAATVAVYVDFAGSAALRRQVHEHFGERLAYSSSIGGTHWQALGSASRLPGPRPTLFFAPAQIAKRSAPPPEGWGAAELQRRLAVAWQAFIGAVDKPEAGLLNITWRVGAAALDAGYKALLAGHADAREGLMVSLVPAGPAA